MMQVKRHLVVSRPGVGGGANISSFFGLFSSVRTVLGRGFDFGDSVVSPPLISVASLAEEGSIFGW